MAGDESESGGKVRLRWELLRFYVGGPRPVGSTIYCSRLRKHTRAEVASSVCSETVGPKVDCSVLEEDGTLLLEAYEEVFSFKMFEREVEGVWYPPWHARLFILLEEPAHLILLLICIPITFRCCSLDSVSTSSVE